MNQKLYSSTKLRNIPFQRLLEKGSMCPHHRIPTMYVIIVPKLNRMYAQWFKKAPLKRPTRSLHVKQRSYSPCVPETEMRRYIMAETNNVSIDCWCAFDYRIQLGDEIRSPNHPPYKCYLNATISAFRQTQLSTDSGATNRMNIRLMLLLALVCTGLHAGEYSISIGDCMWSNVHLWPPLQTQPRSICWDWALVCITDSLFI